MSNTTKDVKLSLRVMVNKEKTKVLFAEVGSDFADVLLSFLTLPLAIIVKLLENHYADNTPVFGSITSLYKGLSNLDDAHFSTSAAKQMLLDPRSSFDSDCRMLKLDISKSQRTSYFACNKLECGNRGAENICICMYYEGSARCSCGNPLSKVVSVHASDYDYDSRKAGVFTEKLASFIICDDLQMVPFQKGLFHTLGNFGIKGEDVTELMNVTFGADEIMDLLKCCLFSKTPLSNVILNKGGTVSSPLKPEHFFQCQMKQEESREITVRVRVMVHKSTNKVLFAQADNDFIELLCNFLIIPIAGVESLLDTNTCLNNLDNLYHSISDVTFDKYFISLNTKNRFMNPNTPHLYTSRNKLLPLNEESAPVLYFYRYTSLSRRVELAISRRRFPKSEALVSPIKSPKGEGYCGKTPLTYMVTDDLTVTPCCVSSILSFLDRLNIPLSDVDELEVHIGLQESLNLLKASLTSTSALTNGLINCIMRKQPKLEH